MVLPCVYILKSSGAAAIYCAGAIFSCWEQPEWVAFLICIAVVPYFIIRIIHSESNYPENNAVSIVSINSMEYKFSLSVTLLLFSAILVTLVVIIFSNVRNNNFEPLSIALLCIEILLLLDIAVMRYVQSTANTKEGFVFFSPPRLLSRAALLVILLINTASSDSFLSGNYSWYRPEERVAFWQMSLFMIIFAGLYFAAGFVKLNNRVPDGEGTAGAGKASLTLIRKFETRDIFLILCLALQFSIPAMWIFSNIMLFALGIYNILLGGRKLRLGQLNLGMLLLIYIIVLRFFDMDLSLLQRGIAFIVLGIAFLVCNITVFRKKKRGNT